MSPGVGSGPMPLPIPRRLRKLDRALLRIRELGQRQLEPTAVHPAPLRSPLGHGLHGRLHTPPGEGPWPGVLLVPGGLGSTHQVMLFGRGVGTPTLAGLSLSPNVEGKPSP